MNLQKLMKSSLKENLNLLLLIGELKVVLTQFKTKDNVVLVGLSQLLLPWNVLKNKLQVHSKNSLNNNLLTVTKPLLVATVVQWTPLSDGLKVPKWIENLIILIPPLHILHVKLNILVSIQSKPMLMYHQ
jgi:hypothetical protein